MAILSVGDTAGYRSDSDANVQAKISQLEKEEKVLQQKLEKLQESSSGTGASSASGRQGNSIQQQIDQIESQIQQLENQQKSKASTGRTTDSPKSSPSGSALLDTTV